jgi:hypothetical protein
VKKSKTTGGKTAGGRAGHGRGAVGGRGGKSIAYAALRNSVSGHGELRKIAFTPEGSATATLEIAAVGVSNDEILIIRSINGQPCSRSPKLELKQGERMNLEVMFESAYAGPISMVLSSVAENANAN